MQGCGCAGQTSAHGVVLHCAEKEGRPLPAPFNLRTMSRLCMLLAVLTPHCTDALVCRDTSALTRRGLLQRTVVTGVTLGAAPVWADTQPILSEQSSASVKNEEKRAKFITAQKVYKKAWRKELANLEYATSDLETVEAIEALSKARR